MAREPARGGIRACTGIASSLLLACSLATPRIASADDNEDLDIAIGALIGTHNFALPLSFLPDPYIGIPAGAVTFGTNLGLKDTRAVFVTPNGWTDWPNTADECHFQFNLPQSSAEYSNLLGFVNLDDVPSNWGELTRSGTIDVVHANTSVNVRALSPYITPDLSSPQTVLLPPGEHGISWRAETQISDAFDIVIPAGLLTSNVIQYGAAVANSGASAARQAATQNAARKTLKNLAINTGLVGASQFFGTRSTVSHNRSQDITIWKPRGPEISTTSPTITLEATDFGGVLYSRIEDQLLGTINASDPCEMPFSLDNDARALLGIGSNSITWTVADAGPLPGGGFNSQSLVQQVMIEDTQGPIMVPPPGRVIEIPSAQSGLNAADVVLGAPRVVDLADAAPAIDNDGPAFYPIDSRSPITWTATDASGNASTGDQLITIKAEGTNTSPVANDVQASTLTAQPVDIVLSGSDSDFIDGRFDPLSVRILDRPANGEFVAPLLPFFIEDYRTQPGGPYGEDFIQADNPNQWLYQNVCQVLPGPDNDKIPLDWVHRPRYVHVTDSGLTIMIDYWFRCGPSSVSRNQRMSFWDANGEYIDQDNYSGTNETFVVDQDEFIYTLSRSGGGSSTKLNVNQSLESVNPEQTRVGGDNWPIGASSTQNPELGLSDPVQASKLSYGRLDSRRGVLYVTDRRRVFVFDVLEDINDGEPNDHNQVMFERYRGALKNGEQFVCTTGNWGNDWTGFAIEVDPEGAVYVTDTCADRIHKIEPTTRDENGELVLGEYVGWLGRCETSTNNACDEQRQASKGYSCTDETCSVGSGGTAGSEDGQFDDVVFVAMDPNGVLYAADAGDPDAGGRVQRFASDGSFAGTARSTGTGINQGDRPGFVLGNMGTVKAVSVNSTQFFVVDQEESFVNVFETSPLKDITDDSATVSYVSAFRFHSDTDTFSYSVSDGLAESAPALVSVQVDRNFRPPVALDQFATTPEDLPMDIELIAEDPDGILGIDFNGLDQLNFVIPDTPENGQLSFLAGDDASVTLRYTPDADFVGEDRFTFVANDGVDDSNTGEVIIDVTYVDDPPRILSVDTPPRVGVGFPFSVRAEYEDDGGQNYTTTLDPGDGSPVLVAGEVVETDDESRIDGVLMINPAQGEGKGMLIAQHRYSDTTTRTLEFCVADGQGRESCEQASVTPEPLVSLALDLPDDFDGTPPAPVSAGNFFSVDVVIDNQAPDGAAGLIAQAIRMQGSVLGEGVRFVSASEGSCTISPDGQSMDCDFGDFAVGEQRSITLTFTSDGQALDTIDALIDLSFTTDSEAVNEIMQVSVLRVIESTIAIFRDRFEG
ncbi:MAG: Ig-like domain-containing protein [Xanthomonadales bacterium]|nr:Ig-like domain-containing protein [Xanthomonadales bacterium]